jgi:AcrR family transcriptional regulator
MEQVSDTRLKIMEAARFLFAEQSFEGTSVRDIAKEAGVNVASLNYHFSSKEKLFDEIIHMGYLECSENLRVFYELNHPNLEETLIYLFKYFINKSHDLLSYFKMMMSPQHNQRVSSQGTPDAPFGPPGGAVIVEAIKKEVGGDLLERDLHWALKSLFGHVVHMAIMHECCFKKNELPYSSQDDLESNIRKLCQVVIKELRTSSD